MPNPNWPTSRFTSHGKKGDARRAALPGSTAVAPMKKDTTASRGSQVVRDLAKARRTTNLLKEDKERLSRENGNLYRENERPSQDNEPLALLWEGSP